MVWELIDEVKGSSDGKDLANEVGSSTDHETLLADPELQEL